MKHQRHLAVVLLLAALGSAAGAQGLTRAQVQADLAAAQQNGDLLLASGLREKDLFPGRYPADLAPVGKTRDEVKAELAMAIRDGDMLAPGDSGLTEYQLEPGRYAQQRAIDQQAMLAAGQHASIVGTAAN